MAEQRISTAAAQRMWGSPNHDIVEGPANGCAKARHVIYGAGIAAGFRERFVGLMGRREVPRDWALFFPCCRSVHTCFMRVPIDVVYLSVEGRVLGREQLEPWRLGHAPAGTEHVMECAAGQASEWGIVTGDEVWCLTEERDAAKAAGKEDYRCGPEGGPAVWEEGER